MYKYRTCTANKIQWSLAMSWVSNNIEHRRRCSFVHEITTLLALRYFVEVAVAVSLHTHQVFIACDSQVWIGKKRTWRQGMCCGICAFGMCIYEYELLEDTKSGFRNKTRKSFERFASLLCYVAMYLDVGKSVCVMRISKKVLSRSVA